MEWMQRSKCRIEKKPVAFFYPDFKESTKRAKVAEYCSDCPVKGLCRDFGIANKEEHGMWGGVYATQLRERTYRTVDAPHGTVKRARQHYRRRELPCQPCLDAWNKHCYGIKQARKV